jgi:dolichyl-phosphate-mannose--protein O-mannosyl transferase
MEMTTLVLLLLVPLAVWRIYSRLKRLMCRTKSEMWHHYLSVGVMAAMLLAVAVNIFGNWIGLAALLAGAIIGVVLGQRNMKLSRLENRPDGFFYTPNRTLGLLVAMLFISRLIYRLFEAYLHMHDGLPLEPDFLGNPISAWLFGLFGGFFGMYALLLIQWRRAQKPMPRPVDIFDIK